MLFAIGVTLAFGVSSAAGAKADKVQICQRSPGDPANYRTITVNAKAAAAHLAQGALAGPCETQCAALCDDGDACTIDTSVWDAGARRCACSSTPVVCAASDECHDAGVCDPTTGVCSNPAKPDGAACDDGNACTRSDTCEAGTCLGRRPVVCTASDQCHDAGTCDPATGHCSNPASVDGTTCDDGDPMTAGEQCRAGTCGGGEPVFRPTTCREILASHPETSMPDGVYMVDSPSGPVPVYCDMTTDGGGWTAVFAGLNGSANVFDRFDAPVHQGICTDPATRCLRRAPAALGESATEIAVSCGPAMVKFPLTVPVRDWLVSGTQSSWEPLAPTVIAGSVPDAPNALWTGSGTNESFIFKRGEGPFGRVFASSYNLSTTYDSCNGVPDQASLVRVYYREMEPTPIHNTPQTAGESCRAIRDAGASSGDGIYWLVEGGGAPYQAYCDMTTDGGGWTAVFAGRNGSANVVDHFDATVYTGFCMDPATNCLRHAPPSLDVATELAVSCGGAMVSFPLNPTARGWLTAGVQAGWTQLTPTVIAGSVPNVPDTLWTGSGANESFIFARGQSPFGDTFASSYNESASFDFCNGVGGAASLVRVLYR